MDAPKREARQTILNAALDLFARRGFEQSSVEDIANDANVETRTVLRHFGDKTHLYEHAVQLAGDRLLHAMRGHLEPDPPRMAETLAEWVGTLEQDDVLWALTCAPLPGTGNPAVGAAPESLNRRLVEFWERRLGTVHRLPKAGPTRRAELAHLIVAAAWAFAAARRSQSVSAVASALMAAFAATVERMVAGEQSARTNGWHVEPAPREKGPRRLSGESHSGRRAVSPRELAVLFEVEKGISNKEIARELNVTEATVKFHLRNIFAKWSVSRRTEALKVARELGVI